MPRADRRGKSSSPALGRGASSKRACCVSAAWPFWKGNPPRPPDCSGGPSPSPGRRGPASRGRSSSARSRGPSVQARSGGAPSPRPRPSSVRVASATTSCIFSPEAIQGGTRNGRLRRGRAVCRGAGGLHPPGAAALGRFLRGARTRPGRLQSRPPRPGAGPRARQAAARGERLGLKVALPSIEAALARRAAERAARTHAERAAVRRRCAAAGRWRTSYPAGLAGAPPAHSAALPNRFCHGSSLCCRIWRPGMLPVDRPIEEHHLGAGTRELLDEYGLVRIGVAHRKGPDPRRMKPRLRCDAAPAQRSVRAWCREPA